MSVFFALKVCDFHTFCINKQKRSHDAVPNGMSSPQSQNTTSKFHETCENATAPHTHATSSMR
jgi:hypothetical protein